MSSFTRTLQRRRLRAAADYEPKPQFTHVLPTGYITLHPTKGWKLVSGKRLEARSKIEQMQVAALMRHRPAVRKAPRNDSAAYRGIGGAGPVRQAAA